MFDLFRPRPRRTSADLYAAGTRWARLTLDDDGHVKLTVLLPRELDADDVARQLSFALLAIRQPPQSDC